MKHPMIFNQLLADRIADKCGKPCGRPHYCGCALWSSERVYWNVSMLNTLSDDHAEAFQTGDTDTHVSCFQLRAHTLGLTDAILSEEI